MKTIRIFIVEDHPVTLKGLLSLFSSVSDFEICGHAQDGNNAFSQINQIKPDIAIVDLKLPGMDGDLLAKRIISKLNTYVFIVTAYEDEELITKAISSGAHGYALKTIDPNKLIEAVRVICKGEKFLDSPLANTFLSKYQKLSKENTLNELGFSEIDVEVLRMLSVGLTYKQIADKKHYSEITIKRRAMNIYSKLNAVNSNHAIALAMEKGLL